MRIEKEKAIEMIERQLYVSDYERAYCVVEISLKNLRKEKKEINDVIREEENAWINKEKTKEIFKFLELNNESDGCIRMKYSTLINEEISVIMACYSCQVKGSSDEIYWYPEKAQNLIKALSYLNTIVVKNLNEDNMAENVNFTRYIAYLDFQEDFADSLSDEISWDDTTDLNLYPEYNYND